MFSRSKLLLSGLLLLSVYGARAQRTYAPNSVLATGSWYKLAVSAPGVYRIDLPFLNNLGVTGSIPSAAIRLFGNGGAPLNEAAGPAYTDDLVENAITVVDGGDGTLNGSDYILFYAPGPHPWVKDSLNQRFSYINNPYSDRSFYFLSIGGTGLRMATQASIPPAATTVTSFDERYHHELDTVNFLASGREWFGEEFSAAPGRSLTRTFNLPLTDLAAGPATLITDAAARSVNASSRLTMSVNGSPVQQLSIAPISTALYDLFAQQSRQTSPLVFNGGTAAVTATYIQGSFNSQAWLNWFEFFGRRNLALSGGRQLLFRDWNSVGTGTAEFVLTNADATTQVWEVTDPARPVRMATTLASGQLRFARDAQQLREYVAFSNSWLTPTVVGRLTVQNLHSTSEKDLFIITDAAFQVQANRIALFHQQNSGLRTLVVTTEQVFNEFGSGSPDPTAIRDFVKMYYDRYRATWTQRPKSLLLLGRASYDYKDRIRNNTNFIPAYESPASLDPLTTYTSDDYFGFLDDHEDINSGVVTNLLDIGIGRIPARTAEEVKNFVDKVQDYHSAAAFGPWRNNLNFVADDEDFNLHLNDAESLTATTEATNPVFNEQKIYLDAFRQESGSAGGRYPAANAMINSNIYNGTLIWNYSGHGGPARLAEEVVIDQSVANGWNNAFRLPLFITATCDFAPYDNPTLNSLGENLIVRPKTGAIALMTTTRLVFANSNRILNNNYLKVALQPEASGRYKTLGEAMVGGKNLTYQTSGDIINNRKFTLLGDPAMTLAFPTQKVRVTRVNGRDLSAGADTLSAAETAIVEGEVTNAAGAVLSGFNGTANLTLFDKPQTVQTLANDPSSTVTSFQTRENPLFRGKATVTNGRFTLRFKVPKDINYQYGNGAFSLYAQNGSIDGNGLNPEVIIGGLSSTVSNDTEGPEIRAYLNDERFVNGSITNTNPILLLKLADSSGINTGGSGIGHDLVATLDGDNRTYYVLNNFYESDLDNFQKGSLRFQLPELSPGAHSLKIKAWDALNNSSEYLLEFTVAGSESIRLEHVLNYPNPFTTKTNFWFEHNAPGQDLQVRVEIFSLSGKGIKTISRTINTTGNRSVELEWDGLDAYGDRIGKGVYLYRLRVRTADGRSAEKWERLVLLGK